MSKGGIDMKRFTMKALLLLLLLALPLTLVSCGGDDEAEETDTQTIYETEDEEGWSPIWRP